MDEVITKDAAIGLLCEAIVDQAENDYASLERRGLESATEKHFTYSKEEIKDFFDSKWGFSIMMLAHTSKFDRENQPD